MKLYVLFGQRKEQYAPEALLCWEEYSVDENPDGWEEAVEAEKAKALKSEDFSALRVITVAVDGNKIARLLNDTPAVTGTIEEE